MENLHSSAQNHIGHTWTLQPDTDRKHKVCYQSDSLKNEQEVIKSARVCKLMSTNVKQNHIGCEYALPTKSLCITFKNC